jgi:hypothetical protein
MASHIESRCFEASNDAGDRYVIVAEREIFFALGYVERRAPWRFRLEDGRVVTPSEGHGSYTIDADGVRLTSRDPNEPKD